MPFGQPRSESEREQRHFDLFGTEPPEIRQRLGPMMDNFEETVWAWLPEMPFSNGQFNPPIPRWLNVKLSGAGKKLS